MKRRIWRAMGASAGATALLAAALSGAQAAQGPPPGAGHGGGGGHGGGETTLANNLSVPTIMVGGGFTNVNCPSGAPAAIVAPTGTPYTGYPIDPSAYYYVQGLNTWQAQCYTDTAANATAAWGDNLTGDAALKTNSPIRVELGLFNSDTGDASMDGYTVVKLNPDALDRESPYGTLATADGTGFSATPTAFAAINQRVYDAGTTFSIKNDAANTYVVPIGTKASAEINATGAVVYGYNLRVTTAGTYTIEFVVPTVSITGADAGSTTAHSATLQITVTANRGGGRGGR